MGGWSGDGRLNGFFYFLKGVCTIPGVAYNGLSIQQSVASGYVSYEYRVWDSQFEERCDTIYDEEGNPVGEDCWWIGGWRHFNDTADATINGVVNASSNVFVNGTSVATTASTTSENWVSGPLESEVVSVSPGTSGSGSGTVAVGNNSNVYVNGQSVAVNGSAVNTHLGTSSQIMGGSSNVFIS